MTAASPPMAIRVPPDERAPRRRRCLLLIAAVAVVGCRDATSPVTHRHPEDARFITEDIPRFWDAFARMSSSADTMPLRTQYLDRGTAGLREFTALRWKNARTLAQMVWPRQSYYRSIEANSRGVDATIPALRNVYASLDTMLDDAVFPDVYFAIGGLATGGTTGPHGLLIGAEMFSRAADSPLGELSPWQSSVVRGPDMLPAIVAHELTHYQQHFAKRPATLLEQSIMEGSADFIGERLSGRANNGSFRPYGDAHEHDLWTEFQAEMDGTDVSRWLYNGGTIVAGSDRPADLGYYIGYRIAEAYFARQADAHAAVREILTISNFHDFLARSGYRP
jgi:hypothetical protein